MRNVDSKYDAFHSDNALMYHTISKLFTDMDLYCHVKRERVSKMIKLCLDIIKQLLGPSQCVRQATYAERKLKNS